MVVTEHRRRKWGRRGRARGPNILASCRFGAAVFFSIRKLFVLLPRQRIAYRVVHVSRFQWFYKLLTHVASYWFLRRFIALVYWPRTLYWLPQIAIKTTVWSCSMEGAWQVAYVHQEAIGWDECNKRWQRVCWLQRQQIVYKFVRNLLYPIAPKK